MIAMGCDFYRSLFVKGLGLFFMMQNDYLLETL